MVIVVLDKSMFEQTLSEFIDSCIKEDLDKFRKLIEAKPFSDDFSKIINYCVEDILQSTVVPEELGLTFRSEVGNTAILVINELFREMVEEFKQTAFISFRGRILLLEAGILTEKES